MPVNNSITEETWLRYQYCIARGHIDFLFKAEKCDNFLAGMQWAPEDLSALRAQKRPALTINKIISTVQTILGQQIFNRTETAFRPKSGSPPEIADALSKVFSSIATNNQLPWTRSDVFCDGIVRSRGFYDVRMDFTDSMRGDIAISHLNSKNVVVDPDAEEYDPDKWGDVIITKWMTPQDISILYSKDDGEYLSTKDSSMFPYTFDVIDLARDRFGGNLLKAGYYGDREPHGVRRNVRVLDRQYRRLDNQKHFVDPKTGDMRPIPDEWDRDRIAAVREKYGLEVTKKLTRRIRWTVTADNVCLHDDWSPYKHFTVVPYFPLFRYGQTLGVVEHLIDPQELLNKTSSQMLHVINTTANSGWKMKKGSLKNMSVEELEQYGAKTGLVLELDEIDNIEKIQPNQIPSGLERITQTAEEHIKTISNVTDTMQGNDREDVAAKAIQAKQQMSSANFSKALDNLERTDWLLARNILDLVQEYYTEERVINITHDSPTQDSETLTVNQMTPEGELLNDLTVGEYDIVITSVPFRATLEDSQFEQAQALRQMGVQIPDDILIENSRLMRKGEIVRKITQQSQSPEAQQDQQLQLRAKEANVSKLEAEAQQHAADAKLKSARAEKEIQLIQQGGEQGGSTDAQKLEAEIALKREQMDREFELKREQMDREFALKQEQLGREHALAAERAAHEARSAALERAKEEARQPTEGEDDDDE